MTDAFEERKKALEEEYFHRQERAALEKLRAKMNAEKAAAAGLRCPKGCDGTLTAVTMQGVVVDRCEKCGGVWLDAGELETLTAQDVAVEKTAATNLRCPKSCEATLTAVTTRGIVIDRCEKCGGIWLDAGELETLTAQDKASGGFLSWLFGSR